MDHESCLIYWLILSGSFAATLFSILSAKEQSDRIKNSGLGALASGIVSIILTLSDAGNIMLLVFSFAGSSFGALIGWIFLYIIVHRTVKKNSYKNLSIIDLLYTGLSGVKDQIERNRKFQMLQALKKWNLDFTMTMNKQLSDKKENVDEYESTIYTWLKVTCDLYHIIFSILGKERFSPDHNYQMRASLIVFGEKEDGEIVGYHRISYEGDRSAFKRSRPFNEESDAYKIVINTISSPGKFDIKLTNQQSQSRESDKNESPYKSFLMFRVNAYSAITVDWPSHVEEDEFFDILKSLFHISICPNIANKLKGEEQNILKRHKLKPMFENTSPDFID